MQWVGCSQAPMPNLYRLPRSCSVALALSRGQPDHVCNGLQRAPLSAARAPSLLKGRTRLLLASGYVSLTASPKRQGRRHMMTRARCCPSLGVSSPLLPLPCVAQCVYEITQNRQAPFICRNTPCTWSLRFASMVIVYAKYI